MASLSEEGDIMNLHDEPIGSVFWTQDGNYRARLELNVKGTDIFECVLFNDDGLQLRTVRYSGEGKALCSSSRFNLTKYIPTH